MFRKTMGAGHVDLINAVGKLDNIHSVLCPSLGDIFDASDQQLISFL